MFIGACGETLPYADSCNLLDEEQKDPGGLPLVRVLVEYPENQISRRKDGK